MIVESNNLAGISTKQSINSSRNKKNRRLHKKKAYLFCQFRNSPYICIVDMTSGTKLLSSPILNSRQFFHLYISSVRECFVVRRVIPIFLSIISPPLSEVPPPSDCIYTAQAGCARWLIPQQQLICHLTVPKISQQTEEGSQIFCQRCEWAVLRKRQKLSGIAREIEWHSGNFCLKNCGIRKLYAKTQEFLVAKRVEKYE